VHIGEHGEDLAGFRDAEFAIKGDGLLPVAAGLARIVGSLACTAQTVVGASPLVLVSSRWP
jgi:hypothetical protein